MSDYENYNENKTHGELSFPYNTYPCSIPQDFASVPLHWHEEVEIIYIKRGKGIVTVDFNEYPVSEGTIVLIMPGQMHAIESYHEGGMVCKMEYENTIFHPTLLLTKGTDACNRDFLLPLFAGQITVPTVYTPVYPYYSDVVAPIDACDEIRKTMPLGYELYIKSMLFQLMFILNNRCRNHMVPKKDRKTMERIKIVLKYVEMHYAEHIFVEDVARLLDFSESHFMRYFKNVMGTSFVEYLKQYRLKMAARLLNSTEDTILTIAGEVGFDNLSYFNRAFKTEYGMTPSQFRKARFSDSLESMA